MDLQGQGLPTKGERNEGNNRAAIDGAQLAWISCVISKTNIYNILTVMGSSERFEGWISFKPIWNPLGSPPVDCDGIDSA
jgi:hypothetical protein